MGQVDITKLIKLISERLDPDELVDVLGYSTAHLCVLLRSEIMANREKFEEFLDVFDQDEEFWTSMYDDYEGEEDDDEDY